jgi:squalene-associated FAD-dependent desaturase
MNQRCVIVGGGLAGLAAATALSSKGVQVTLLESRPRLGGRASSIVDRETGELIDNCQHVSMGCCTNFQDLMNRLDLADCFRREYELYFIGPDGQTNRFSAARWPAPFHLFSAFRRLSYLSRDDLRAIKRALRALCKPISSTGSFLTWLQNQNQPQTAIDRFWHVVLVSALSETLDRIDVSHARKVFKDGFLANRHGWEVDIPIVPLTELYGERLQNHLLSNGGEVRLQTGVEQLVIEENQAVAVELKGGEHVAADDFVLAVPHDRLSELLPAGMCDHSSLAGLSKLEMSPISSVHLWFDKPIMELPHAVLIDRFSQWIFNRTAIRRDEKKAPHSWYYQIVISASRAVTERPHEETVHDVMKELTAIFPEMQSAKLRHSRVITEHKAVFSPKPGVDLLRPGQQSPIPNLQWAGDWTQTGWPATMEGAVRSGYLAAENILKRQGRAEQILQPDQPTGFLSKWLLRL